MAIPPGDAELHVSIDGHVHCRQVGLVDGIPANASSKTKVRVGQPNGGTDEGGTRRASPVLR